MATPTVAAVGFLGLIASMGMVSAEVALVVMGWEGVAAIAVVLVDVLQSAVREIMETPRTQCE